MTDSLNKRQQLLARHTQSQSHRQCYSLGVNGRQWDVSNLRSIRWLKSPSTSCRQFERLSKGYPLYPSQYLVKAISDVHVNSIFDGCCKQEQQQAGPSEEQHSSTYQEGLLRPSSEHKESSKNLDFREDFTCISQKSSTRTIDEQEASRADDNSVSNTGEQKVAQEKELKEPPPALQMEIEMSPGYYPVIRGAAETTRAIQQGQVSPTICSCCTSLLYCIMVAEYVICSTCLEVSPVDFKQNNSLGQVGGVALGLTPANLQQETRKVTRM
jgi:hypothetical protein